MQGTNTGTLPGGSPTGRSLDLPGADFLTYDASADKLASVVGYFDTATMLGQLGLQAHITPEDMEPVVNFGYSIHVDSGREAAPGAFTVTWIEIDHEYDTRLTESTQAIVMEQLGDDVGYLGSCFAVIGRRHYTFSAWTTPEAAQHALRGDAHTTAMKLAQSGGLGDNARGVTSVWSPLYLNPVFSPSGSRDLHELGGQWL
jgi:hypothetical protein